MTFTDYLLDLVLIGIVVLQIRGRRLTPRSQILPFLIVGYVATQYLHGIPTAGNDLILVAGCTVVGAVLGALCGMFTKVERRGDGNVYAKAGIAAAVLWVLGVGARFAFQLYATHGGGASIGRWSAAHSITSSNAWTAALILMALGEVVFRSGIIAWRAHVIRRDATPVMETAAPGAIMESCGRSI